MPSPAKVVASSFLATLIALYCLIFWLAITDLHLVVSFGLGPIVSGHFSPTEIAMTIIIGIACLGTRRDVSVEDGCPTGDSCDGCGIVRGSSIGRFPDKPDSLHRHTLNTPGLPLTRRPSEG